MATIKNTPPIPQSFKSTELQTLTNEFCNHLFFSLPPSLKRCIVKTVFEMDRAIEKHPEWPADQIHQAAIVSEESGELVRAALQLHYEGGSIIEVMKEAEQTAAMGLRFQWNLFYV